MLADSRHPLRFTLWTLVAIWVTTMVAAGVTYLIVSMSESGEGRYRAGDYNRQTRCTHVPTRGSLAKIHGFTPLPSGETALVSRGENVRAPAVIYLWHGERCMAEWELDDTT